MRLRGVRLACIVCVVGFVAVASGCGPGDDVGPLDCGIAPPLFDPRGDVVHAEGPEGCVRIERRAISLGDDFMCKACPYEATRLIARLTLDADGDDARLDVDIDISDTEASADRDDAGALTYEPTHHNWLDVVAAPARAFSARILFDVESGGWDLEVDVDMTNGNDDDDGDDGDDGDELLLLPVVGSRT